MKATRFNIKDPKMNLFVETLFKRVDDLIKEKSLKKVGGIEIKIKALILFSLFFTVLFLTYTLDLNTLLTLTLYLVLGRLMAGIGMGVMHDGSHETFSSEQWLNKIAASSILLFAGTPFNWRAQHVVLHHGLTNIHGHDEDLEAGRIMRFSDKVPWEPHHWIQKYPILVRALYSLLTINWSVRSDFSQAKRYLKNRIDRHRYPKKNLVWKYIVAAKIFLLLIWLALPISLGMTWWVVILGFCLMHFVAGQDLSITFQLAHINSKTEKYENIEFIDKHPTVHQFETSANFATDNAILTWCSGGLNHQIEHHVFPHLCSTLYPKISGIVRQTCEEFEVPYNLFATKSSAKKDHFELLRRLSTKPVKLKIV